jgi:preprotein translocase SecF subunit
MSLEVDQAFIAAILTIIGYSVNDTVIVFDRVREHLNDPHKDTLANKINLAINKTLGRTLITSGTTLLTILVLFIFGGDAIRGFAFAITLGIIVGTYSSIYIGSALMYDLTKRKEAAAERRLARTRPQVKA